MSVVFPTGNRVARLERVHPRKKFQSGEAEVDDWLVTKALQNQDKHLSTTKGLIDPANGIAGYYTLATGQIDFGDLPPDEAKKLPRRLLPVAVLAWLGVATSHQGKGIGKRLLAQALRECYSASQTFTFVGVILDCINDKAKAFYQRFDFQELPGHPYRLFLSMAMLEAMTKE